MNTRELEEYITNRFRIQQENVKYDDSFLSQWQKIIDLKSVYSEAEILNKYIVRKFPVNFRALEDITIEIYNSVGGEVPIITFGNSSDFEDFIVNLTCKGSRPDDISQMGASFIYGEKQKFLVLSKKYYSNTEPEYVSLSSEEWREKSMVIRREHECTHYYTKRFYGSASNNLHDELIADFVGIYEAFGYYDAKLFQHFMGIDGTGTNEGRLSLYTVGLSQEVRNTIADIACKCSEYLEKFSKSETCGRMNKALRINYLCETDIKEML